MANLFEELNDADLTTVVGGKIVGIEGELSPGFYSVNSIATLDANNTLLGFAKGDTLLLGATPFAGGSASNFVVEVTEDGKINTNASL